MYKILKYFIKYMKISIIIGYYNRKKQLFHTLKTIGYSSYKNIEIIIIDDCSDNPDDILNNNDFENLNMNIKLISIKKEDKTWVNPCVGYNKGISEATGDIIILQNAEVCHIGDTLSYVINNLKPNDWLTFNCYGLNNFEDNENIYSQNNCKVIYDYINKIWKENNNYSIRPGGNATFTDKVGGWLNHFLYHFTAYHYFGAIFRDDLMNKMKGGFDSDYANGICFDDNDFIKKLIVNNFQFKTNTFSETEPFVIHLYHEKAKNVSNIILNTKNKLIYDKKCKQMNITNDWKLCNFMPNPILCDKKDAKYSDINILIGIILHKNSEIFRIQTNIIDFLNEDASFLSDIIKNINLNIVFCVYDKNNIKIKECINFWKNKFIYKTFNNKISKSINMIDYSSDFDINYNKIAKFKNDLTLKLFINKGVDVVVYPNNSVNILDNIEIYKTYHITNNTNLLELQNNFLEFKIKTNINIIFDKNKYTKEMNTFRKCILSRYFYKNSSIKIPDNLHIKISYKK
jgi:hypothetical protein